MKRAALIIYVVFGAALLARAERTNVSPAAPPMPPLPRYQKVTDSVQLRQLSPVAYFRVLLGMTPAQRDRALAQKQPAERATILRKIAEYEALPADVREARLHQTELRWTLVGLMKLTPAERADRLQTLLSGDRQIVEQRLRQWDQLPVSDRQAYLEKQDFISFYLRWQNANAIGQIEILNKLPADRRARWTTELSHWQNLSDDSRRQITEQFSQWLGMSDPQRQAAVSALSDRERRQIEASLRAYANLNADQRRQCIQSFGKFASLSAEDRAQFLQNAARWEEMTPQQRQLWRQLVFSLPIQPPLPAGYRKPRPGGLPPLPPGLPHPTTTLAPHNTYAGSVTN